MGLVEKRIKTYIDKKGISIAELERAIGMSNAAFSKVYKSDGHIGSDKIENFLKQYTEVNPVWLISGKGKMFVEEVLPILNDDSIEYNKSRQNIIMIDAKASAGLPGNLHNPVFYKEFPRFTLPGRKYEMGRFICLQIDGDSMHPTVKNNEWVVGQECEDLSIKNGHVYLVVTTESVLCKRLYRKKSSEYIDLISDNDEVYTPREIHAGQIQRIYEAVDKITNDFRNWNSDIRKDLSEIRIELAMLKRDFYKSKK